MKKSLLAFVCGILLFGLASCESPQDTSQESVWFPGQNGVDDPLLGTEAKSFDEVYENLARIDTSCKDEFKKYYDWYIKESKGSDTMTDFLDLVRAQDGDCVVGMSTTSQGDNAWSVQKFDVENEGGTSMFFEICRADRKENGEFTPCSIDELNESAQKYQEFMSGAGEVLDGNEDLIDNGENIASKIPYFDDVYAGLGLAESACKDDFMRYYSMFFPSMDYTTESENFYDLFKGEKGECLLGYSYKQDDNIFWRVVEIPKGDIDFDNKTVVFYTECISGVDENNNVSLCDSNEIEKTHLLYQNFISDYR